MACRTPAAGRGSAGCFLGLLQLRLPLPRDLIHGFPHLLGDRRLRCRLRRHHANRGQLPLDQQAGNDQRDYQADQAHAAHDSPPRPPRPALLFTQPQAKGLTVLVTRVDKLVYGCGVPRRGGLGGILRRLIAILYSAVGRVALPPQ